MSFFPSRTIALAVGPFSVHWYGLCYAAAFLCGMWLLPRLLPLRSLTLTEREREKLFFSVFLGVILGGRIGYVLLYGFSYYVQHPEEIIAVWHGGMSSHGGFIGVAIALILFSRRHRLSLLLLVDVLTVPLAIGLFFGRLGNFINGELYGTVTDLPWALSFPGIEGLRHPTQIYAMLKDACIAFVCFVLLARTRGKAQRGVPTALFLCLYAVLRFIVEYFRDQPFGFFHVFGVSFSRGQLFTIPVFFLGIAVLLYSRRTSTKSA